MRRQAGTKQDAEFGCARLGKDCSKIDMGRDLVGSMLLVLSIELLNSAVEAVIERYGPEYHELAGRAKDMGSAAVFVLMMNVLLTWGAILLPRI